MSRVDQVDKIGELNSERGARGFINQFDYPRRRIAAAAAAASPDRSHEDSARMLNMTPDELAKVRFWLQQVTKESEERLAREMALVYKLNRQRTTMKGVGYITKGEAAEIARVPGGDLLDLDAVHGGLVILGDHLFISEAKIAEGLDRFGSNVTAAALVDGLIREKIAA